MEANIQDVLKYIVKDMELSVLYAMRAFYSSDIFGKLQDYNTRLYLESPMYVYKLKKNLRINGSYRMKYRI